MAVTYDILEPTKDFDSAVERLNSVAGKLYAESWARQHEPIYHKPFALDAQSFVSMWMNRGLKVLVAYDEKQEPVGYLLGIVFRPMTYDSSIFMVEDWYVRDNRTDVLDGLFGYMEQAIKFIGCEEVRITTSKTDRVPRLSGWKPDAEFIMTRYVKE